MKIQTDPIPSVKLMHHLGVSVANIRSVLAMGKVDVKMIATAFDQVSIAFRTNKLILPLTRGTEDDSARARGGVRIFAVGAIGNAVKER